MNGDYKRLVRSTTNKTICGVCGGIGEYANIDPVLVRVIWVIASLGSFGMGILIYFIVALIVPQE
ncbi:MAG: PspC domain-containing protein [Lachnospiraceae bacterium]|jgi:phage shock protein PspC (stress-responsive transcriptional regulator)|nr:PspC domain-containing protein [Lachnospiraceae bacterium]